MHDVDDLDRDAYEVEDDLFICSESFVGPPESPASEFFYGISASAPSMLGGRVNSDLVSARNICACLLYTSPSPRDATLSRMPSSA